MQANRIAGASRSTYLNATMYRLCDKTSRSSTWVRSCQLRSAAATDVPPRHSEQCETDSKRDSGGRHQHAGRVPGCGQVGGNHERHGELGPRDESSLAVATHAIER